MAQQWKGGCLRIEIEEVQGSHPLDDLHARLYIRAYVEGGEELGEVQSEGQLGVQLAHLLHACVVLSGGEDEEWFIPNGGHPLHMRRQGRQIEIARYPAYVTTSPNWRMEGGLYLIDFGMLLESLSAAVEWAMQDLPGEFAEDDMVQVLLQQWERAWQRFSRLATFRRVSLVPVL
jgi:hypothetical protein